jgi:pyruvate dehydrogenase E2 component (dihydrolipoamide acetyltransferase)
MAEFKMPGLGADMASGTLLEWLVKPGAVVKRGDIIAIVGTEKGEIEIEVFEDGIIDQISVVEGTEVPVGAVLALIRGAGAAAPVIPSQPVPPQAPAVEAPVATNGQRIRISPLARKLAAELGVDLAQVTGTGAHGAITRTDIETAATSMKAEPTPKVISAAAQEVRKEEGVKEEPRIEEPRIEEPKVAEKLAPAAGQPVDFATGMRHAIALAMARANRDIPHNYLQTRIDMQQALTRLEALDQGPGVAGGALAQSGCQNADPNA